MSISWGHGVVLLILLFACGEEPCTGNETNDMLVEKKAVEDPGGNFNWDRYLAHVHVLFNKFPHGSGIVLLNYIL